MGTKIILIAILFSILIDESFSSRVPSDDCSREHCRRVERCSKGEYLVKADGIEECCDVCRQYASLNEHCCENQLCSPELYCDENDQCAISEKCLKAKCKPVTSCPDGQYILPRDGNMCCDKCQNYARLGDSCAGNIRCGNNLICGAENVCEKPELDCDAVTCEVIRACPPGTFRLLGDGRKKCCDECQRFAKKGELCHNEKKCGWDLFCNGHHICEPINPCMHVKCASVHSCPPGQYMVHKNMVDICCDSCRDYSGVGQFCDDKYPCAKGLFCNRHNVCEMREPNCASASCHRLNSCSEGEYLVPSDGIKQCCDKCWKYSRFGEPCNKHQKCGKMLICNRDNTCEWERSCPKGTYRNPYTGECIRYAGHDESCAHTMCAEEFHCNAFKRCVPNDVPDCTFVKCRHVEHCSPKQYLVRADGTEVCCNYCENYAKEGERCGKSRKCLPDLKCNSHGTCERPEKDCNQAHCVNVRRCPEGQHLVKAGGKHCCDYCRPHSALGQPCSKKHPCHEGLYCNHDNYCEKIDCHKVECAGIKKCAKGSYLMPADGVTRCCNSCRKSPQEGEYCDKKRKCAHKKLKCKDHICVCKKPPCHK